MVSMVRVRVRIIVWVTGKCPGGEIPRVEMSDTGLCVWSRRRTAGVTAATTGAYVVNGSPGSAVINSRPMAGPPGPSPQRSPQSFNRPPADNIDRLLLSLFSPRKRGSMHRRHFRGVRGVRVPPLFGVGVPYPPLFKSCHKKNYDAEPFFLVLICTNRLSAGAFPQNPRGEFTALPQTP